MTKCSLRALAALLAVALLSVSCGRSSDSTPTTASNPGASAKQSTETAPRHGGELRIPLVGVETLDPARSTNRSEGLVLHQVLQGLVRLDDRLRAVPDLASRWTLSSNRLTYSFEIRKDALFHDGRPVESADVAYSLRRLFDPEIGSVVRPYLVEVLAGPESITCPTPDRCEITLLRPDHVFIQFLAMQHTKVLPRDAAEQADFARRPIGSGPFRVTRNTQSRIRLEAARHGNAHDPYLDAIIFDSLGPQAELEALSKGEIDYSVVAPSEFQEIETLADYRATRVSALELHFLGMRTDAPPFDQPGVRRAVAFAIDRRALEGSTRGRIERARAILPPGIPGHDPAYAPYPHDPKRARALLREAGYGEDAEPFPAVKLLIGRMPEQEILAGAIQNDLAAVGIPVELVIIDDYARFFARLGSTELAILGWGADYPDANDFFYGLFRSDAPYNFMAYSNPLIDELIEEGRRGSFDKLDRARAYRRAETLLMEDCPAVPLFRDAALHCVRRTVRDLPLNAMGIYTSRLDHTWMESRPEEKASAELTSIESAD